jgi:LysR family transcriptional regulator, glycine cleavage system transcriptional activator
VVLTDAGRRYYPELEAALDRMAQATEDVTRAGHRPTLMINVTASAATRWLIPRLSSFCESHPGVEVHLATTEKTLEFNPQLFDVSIRSLDEPTLQGLSKRRDWEGSRIHAFLQEAMFVVCNPRLLETTPLNRLDDLRHHTWLHTNSAPNTWNEWLEVAGVPQLKPIAELTFDKFYLSTQAAARGMGVGIGSLPLTSEELANGSLVAPFPNILSHRKQYYYIIPAKATERPEVIDFCEWLCDMGQATEAATLKFTNPNGLASATQMAISHSSIINSRR